MTEQWRIRKPAVIGAEGMVAAQHWLAAQAGADVLSAGGNAIDAAVTTAYALNAVEPWMCGLGGSGYAVVYQADQQQAWAINFQGVAPLAIDLSAYSLDPTGADSLMGFPAVIDNRNVVGYGAIAVPGAVAGLATLLKRFGSWTFAQVLQPAIALAQQGLLVDWHATLQIALQMDELRQDTGARQIFLSQDCPPQPETRLPLDALAQTLITLAERGPEDFYQGQIAERLVADLQTGGSTITLDDFAAYRVAVEPAQQSEHRGAQLFGADLSSGTQRLFDTLAFVEQTLKPSAMPDAQTYIAYAQGLNQAFAAHKQHMGTTVGTGCTSHLSTVDRAGNMVALTYTLLNRFGSQVVLPQTGVLMNNGIAYFDPRPDRPTSLVGGKRINSSNMCPIIAARNSQSLFALGASGANHIVPAVAQLAALLLDFDMSLEQAFHTPRVDAADRDHVQIDARLPSTIQTALAQHFTLQTAPLSVFPKLYACPSGVMRDPATGLHYGMTDPSAPVANACAAA